MERRDLEAQLATGRSIEAIARDAGRHPSTVAYWVTKYGLASRHGAGNRARGALSRETLDALVEEGLSIRQIAARVDRSYSTVRHWMKRHGLTTAWERRRAEAEAARAAGGPVLDRECPEHGLAPHQLRRDGDYFRCLLCRSAAVAERRRAVKAVLVAEAGGRCVLCGYHHCLSALQFHHLDPAEKDFSLSQVGVTLSLERARHEAAKCVLLCATCHAEVEAGFAELRFPPVPSGAAHDPG